MCHPGAPFEYILQSAVRVSKNYDKSDNVLILAGANNITELYVSLLENLREDLITLASKVTLSIISIPYRHDNPLLNTNIKRANQEIETVSMEVNAHFINCDYLDGSLYNRYGFHLNKRGKVHLSNTIIKSQYKGKRQSLACSEENIRPISVITNNTNYFLEI